MTAQRNALGTIGARPQALKGRDTRRDYFALQGLGMFFLVTQRVAPGYYSRPVGAWRLLWNYLNRLPVNRQRRSGRDDTLAGAYAFQRDDRVTESLAQFDDP